MLDVTRGGNIAISVGRWVFVLDVTRGILTFGECVDNAVNLVMVAREETIF